MCYKVPWVSRVLHSLVSKTPNANYPTSRSHPVNSREARSAKIYLAAEKRRGSHSCACTGDGEQNFALPVPYIMAGPLRVLQRWPRWRLEWRRAPHWLCGAAVCSNAIPTETCLFPRILIFCDVFKFLSPLYYDVVYV